MRLPNGYRAQLEAAYRRRGLNRYNVKELADIAIIEFRKMRKPKKRIKKKSSVLRPLEKLLQR